MIVKSRLNYQKKYLLLRLNSVDTVLLNSQTFSTLDFKTMGRKAKLKKLRRESKNNPATEKQSSSTQFVEELNQLGYQLKEIQRSPEVPKKNIEPQL